MRNLDIFYRMFWFSVFFLLLNISFGQRVPFDSPRWEINARESSIKEYLGHQSLYMKGGLAVVKDSEFIDGVIEFDIAFTGERTFAGAVWRLQDNLNFEQFYIRPHQSGNPDANQYTPVFNGVSGWQLYHGEGYGAPVSYKFNEWIHVKIMVSGTQAEVYIEDMENPALFIHELKREVQSGKVGLSIGNFAPAYFSNFRFAEEMNFPLNGKPGELEKTPDGTIQSWLVSNSFGEKFLENKSGLSASDKAALTWTRIDCESTGLANLARLKGVEEGKNTVFVRTVITATKNQVLPMEFGYSDRIKVYFNDHLIYSGTNGYLTRDYRYLGTIGYFDTVYLPLTKGENELWMAVSEDFGGWGIMAKIENKNEITVSIPKKSYK